LIKVYNNKASLKNISNHLDRVDSLFVPSLSSYVNLDKYSKKIFENADRVELWRNEELVGLLAFYTNLNSVFITNVSLDRSLQGSGFGVKMFNKLFKIIKDKNIEKVNLEVNSKNKKAINFYKSMGFDLENESGKNLLLIFTLK
jgi:ribosomal protein S18 acetylase RimI-like enzyme